MEEPAPHLHRVNERDGKFEVLNDSGSIVLVCEDETSATNYAVLLSEAFQRGYKAGYREGKKLAAGRRKS
jgi:hypothetical protein